jgi:hypothetical protein
MAEFQDTGAIDLMIDRVFGSTPLLFVKDFLRQHRRASPHVRIGTTIKEVRSNLRDALLSQAIGPAQLEQWLDAVEGWGKQHLYLGRVAKRSLTHAHLLNLNGLRSFLTRRGFATAARDAAAEPSAHVISDLTVDDERATITWRSHSIGYERREELDEVRELDDGQYEFRAHRQMPRRSASRFIIRKTDGITLTLIDIPLGQDHNAAKQKIDDTAIAVLAPLTSSPIPLGPILRALDQGAVARFGPRQHRSLDIGVAPTQARYRTDGGRIEFKSTRESSGYADSRTMRTVRQAMEITRFEGEAGKFHLRFEGSQRQPHSMVVSLNAVEERMFLFSRMDETEVLRLADQLIALG